jgi:hypothetical protein
MWWPGSRPPRGHTREAEGGDAADGVGGEDGVADQGVHEVAPEGALVADLNAVAVEAGDPVEGAQQGGEVGPRLGGHGWVAADPAAGADAGVDIGPPGEPAPGGDRRRSTRSAAISHGGRAAGIPALVAGRVSSAG